MEANTKTGEKACPHCLGRRCCDCPSCGQKVRAINFGGKWHKYYESGKCRICGGTGKINLGI